MLMAVKYQLKFSTRMLVPHWAHTTVFFTRTTLLAGEMEKVVM